MPQSKTEQLQIRVSRHEKRDIQKKARAAGLGVSAWVLSRLLPDESKRFHALVDALSARPGDATILASLHDFLIGLSALTLLEALADAPRSAVPQPWRSYLAAMIEHRAHQLETPPPPWVLDVGPSPEPYFASSLLSLRLHLLTHSPQAFRRRNLFVDAVLGERV
ncbi:MAG: plasmid mobilization protein [Myxococcaceae bacterium]